MPATKLNKTAKKDLIKRLWDVQKQLESVLLELKDIDDELLVNIEDNVTQAHDKIEDANYDLQDAIDSLSH